MKLQFFIKKIMFDKYYLGFMLFQILLTALIIIYVVADFKNNIRNRLVIHFELVLAFLMILDIVFYLIITQYQFSLVIIVEWFIIMVYLIIVILLEFQEIAVEDEILEFYLILGRFSFQIFRLGMGFVRLSELNQGRKVTEHNIELDLEKQDPDDEDINKENSQMVEL